MDVIALHPRTPTPDVLLHRSDHSLPTFLALDKVLPAAVCQLVDTAPPSANATAQLTSTNTGSASAATGCTLIAGPIGTPP
jgi:hypothetical protein